jgi:hypothetical protein
MKLPTKSNTTPNIIASKKDSEISAKEHMTMNATMTPSTAPDAVETTTLCHYPQNMLL